MPPNMNTHPPTHTHAPQHKPTPPNAYTCPRTRTHAPQRVCVPPNTYARPPTRACCHPAVGDACACTWVSGARVAQHKVRRGRGHPARARAWAWAYSEGEGVGVDREGEGEGEEHGQKLAVGVSIETWCLGEGEGMWWAKVKARGVWWAKACGWQRRGHVVGKGEQARASKGLTRGEVEHIVRCFDLEFLDDWNGCTGAA
ncbi:hypothetical protein DFH94DRAFT_810632 [Russula ochroleuca]|uniref:Uncharacterized protein n=1 Tax=Russula ochroleuca TaxID=152965 RepID=A0A9P5MPG4_9AGAM|nr:hypothetical protein DFH94DRAFT_810632 [Russula ochroleuca]